MLLMKMDDMLGRKVLDGNNGKVPNKTFQLGFFDPHKLLFVEKILEERTQNLYGRFKFSKTKQTLGHGKKSTDANILDDSVDFAALEANRKHSGE